MYSHDVTAQLIKTNASDIDVARAAWVSTAGLDAREKDSDNVQGLINFLYRNRHMSPFEHGSFTFMIDCPIFVAREFHRHRTFSYNEVSGRYSVMKPRFYMPGRERPLVQVGKIGYYTFEEGTDEQYAYMVRCMVRAYDKCWEEYNNMLYYGIAKEVARDVLPLGLYTQFYATCNPRNLMQFLDLRTADDALYEIRAVAGNMEQHFKDTMPMTYTAWKES